MNKPTQFSALVNLKKDLRQITREHEVCRLQFDLPNIAAADTSRDIILKWAERKTDKTFSKDAWSFESFESLSGGRSTLVSTIKTDNVSIWALRNEVSDDNVATRVWSTEIVIGQTDGENPRMSVRLLAHSKEEYLPIKISVPGFVLEIFRKVGLTSDITSISMEPKSVDTLEKFSLFIELLQNPSRKLPIIAITLDPQKLRPLIIPNDLAKKTLGLAHTYILSPFFAGRLSDAVGDAMSVFGGGIRLYMPGFEKTDPWYAHKLLVARNLKTPADKGKADVWFRRLVAEFSFDRLKLGKDVLSYARVRSESRKLRAIEVLKSDSSLDDQLEALMAQLKALENERDETFNLSIAIEDEKNLAIERAEDAEQKLQSAGRRVSQLEQALQSRGDTSVEIQDPAEWPEIVDWCSQKFVGKLTLTPSAVRGLKKPEYEDLKTVVDTLEWLATQGREARISGAGGRMNNERILGALTHARCGGDEYQTMFKGSRRDVDWHIKNGDGNTRDPSRCLRIYYFWDEQTQEIIVADLPAHRKNENS